MNTDKPILDDCCSGKMFYYDKQDPRVLFQDIREVETILCDGRAEHQESGINRTSTYTI